MKTSSGDPLYQGFLTELHRSLCNRDSALNTESNMNSPFSRVRLNLEGPGIANEPRVESSSQARSNGQESAGFIEAGSVAVNSAMNPIDAISLHSRRVSDLLADPSFISQSSFRSVVQSLTASWAYLPWNRSRTIVLMSEVDYLGELNDVLIFRERITGVGKGNKNIIAYNEIDHVKKILMLNDPGLDNGIVLVVKCWEARGFIITGHEHGHLLVWDVDSGDLKYRLRGLYQAASCIAVTEDLVVACGRGGKICIWNSFYDESQPIRTFWEHTSAVMCVEPRENFLVSGSADGEVRYWDMASNRCIRLFRDHNRPVQFVCFDGRSIVAASSESFSTSHSDIKVWRLGAEGFSLGTPQLEICGPRHLTHLLLHDDCLTGAGRNGEILKCDLVNEQPLVFTDQNLCPVAALDTKGPITIIGGEDGSVELMDHQLYPSDEALPILSFADKIWAVKVIDAFTVSAIYEKDGVVSKALWWL